MNNTWLDKKYINLIAAQLPLFAWKSSTMANFRCILCGDSKQNKHKTRAYLYPFKNNGYMMKCHNCSTALIFPAFLKRVSRALYDEYVLERFTASRTAPAVPVPSAPAVHVPPTRMYTYPHVNQLSSPTLPADVQPVRTYVEQRGLPASALSKLYATTHAQSWLAPLVGADKAAKVRDGHPYLVIPLRLPDRQWYGTQLRPLDQKHYITFRWSHDPLRTFGLEHYTPGGVTYCFEGPLDALCVPGSLAFCGADLVHGLDRTRAAGYSLTTPVLTWDNEPRSKEITRQIQHAIDAGHHVVIWPQHLHQKDANDMYAAGVDVAAILPSRTFQGLRAELEFRQWKQR